MCRLPLEVMICTEIRPNLTDPRTTFQSLYELCPTIEQKNKIIEKEKEKDQEKKEKKSKKKKNLTSTTTTTSPTTTTLSNQQENISSSSIVSLVSTPIPTPIPIPINNNESTQIFAYHEEGKLFSPTSYMNNILLNLLIFRCPVCSEVSFIFYFVFF